MNQRKLDRMLRTETPSEHLYKENTSFHNFEQYPLVQHNGKSVRLLEIKSEAQTESSMDKMLFIKKQAKYQACPLHMHNFVEFSYMYSGNCTHTIHDTTHTLTQGQVILIDTNTPHATERLGENDILINVLIEKSYLNSNFFNRFSRDSIVSQFFINEVTQNTNHDNFIIFHSEQSQKLQFFFNQLLCEMYDPSVCASDMVHSLFVLVLCELINVYEKQIKKQELYLQKNSVAPILRYIESNYTKCSLESTAAFFNINPNYLTTLLKQKTGYSYKELVQNQRFNQAC